MYEEIRSTNPNIDTSNPLVKPIIEFMVQRGREANEKLNIGDNVYIDNCDGTYTPALFIGDISDTLVLVKPKESKGGYGTNITCLKKLIVTEIKENY